MDKTKVVIGYFLIVLSIVISSCESKIKDRDGNIYKEVNIGKQKWMAENLTVCHFRNGDTIPEVRSAEDWIKFGEEGKPAWCYEENNPITGKKYGKLYNWYAVNDPRGLAPKGCHVPSDSEWKQFTVFFGGEISSAIQMRTSGLTGKSNRTFESGFSGLPGGNRSSNGTFFGIGSYGYWWSATELNTSKAWIRILDYPHCNLNNVGLSKQYGLSVRCLRD